MLSLDAIDKQYGPQVLLQQASLLLHPGEKAGLIGPNGAGKTTLFRIIEGIEEFDGGQRRLTPPTLRIGVLRQELSPSERSILQETLLGDAELTALLKQRDALHTELAQCADADAQMRLSHDLGEAEHRLEEIDAYSAEARAGAILQGLGFAPQVLAQPLNAFSGGWRMRVALAQLLFSRPDLMLLDEPTNHLDLESAAWLERYLANQPGAFLLISHDRGLLQRACTVIVELEGRKLTRYKGDFTDYLQQKETNLALLEKQAAAQDARIAELTRFITRFRAKATKARQAQSRVKQLEKIERIELPESARKAPVIRLPEPPPCAREMATLRNVHKAFGETQVFTGFNLDLIRGGKIGLLGPNGQGKSTFLKLLSGALAVDAGTLALGDRVQPGHFAQHALEALNPEESVLDAAWRAAPKGMDLTGVRNVLGGLLFSGESVEKRVAVLSGGEKARLALARLFLSGANLLLLDEPTNHLDMGARAALEEALESYTGSIILVSHDRDLLEAACDSYWVVGDGAVRPWEGELEDYLEQLSQTPDALSNSSRGAADASNPSTAPDAKTLKRLEAEIRNRLHQQTKPLKQRLARHERDIEALENEKGELDAALADTALYEEQNKQRLQPMVERHGRLNVELSEKMSAWEQDSERIEELEQDAQDALAALRGSL
ncbi:ABC-F family ATP-binding cassette domain-containing protein [Magnetofaba australis]|uniref:Putative ABC transporter n=1 Tax=Magnetofaba australis IT-1 TaxID=1434232 RepID=A0A1Y2K7H4_9PROT|nr:ABC-F family ATP-binding cassette domain-containing protein [Magnetofaba australis]OSM04411.1 putative ABC transporter [Magnetofaba australis IT-1]